MYAEWQLSNFAGFVLYLLAVLLESLFMSSAYLVLYTDIDLSVSILNSL